MGKEHNISEVNRQLGDTTYYKQLDQEEISEDNIEYLTVANPRATLDAQLSLQTVTQPNGSQSLLTYTTCL